MKKLLDRPTLAAHMRYYAEKRTTFRDLFKILSNDYNVDSFKGVLNQVEKNYQFLLDLEELKRNKYANL